MTPTKPRADSTAPGKEPPSGRQDKHDRITSPGASEPPTPLEPLPTTDQILRLFQAVSEGSIAGVYVFQDDRFLYVNPALAKIFGYERDELVGKMGPAEITHPDDRSKVAEYARRRIAEEVESAHYTLRGLRKDGGLIQCEVLGYVVEFDGKPAVAGTLLDITERERTQRDLQESEALFRSLALKSPNAIYINQAGRVVFANPAAVELMGYSQAELISEEFDFLHLIAPESLEPIQLKFREHMQGRELAPYECGLIRKNGTSVETIIATRLISYEGNPAILGVVTDVTERKAAERELRRLLHEERQHRKLAEAVARVGLSLTSELELKELLDLISKESTEVFEVRSAFVWMVEGDELVGFAGHGQGIDQFVGLRLPLHDSDSLAARVVREANPHYVNFAKSSHLVHPGLVASFGVQAVLGVPLIRLGKAEGALLLLDTQTPDRFSDHDLETAMVLGGQMAIAIESAQLVRRDRRRLHHLTALMQSSTVISSTLDLATILTRITEEMCRAIDATSAFISTYDPEAKTSTVITEYYSSEAIELESDLGHTYDLETEFPGTIEGLEALRPSVAQADDPDLSESQRSHMLHYGGKSALTIPFEIGGQVHAFAEMWESRARREFTQDEKELCLAIGRQAAIAIENGRLYKHAREELAERRRAESALAITVRQLEMTVVDAGRLAATEAALRDSAAALSGTLDLDEVLDRILSNVGRVVPSDTVDIMLLERRESGDILVGVRGRGYAERGLSGWLERLRLKADDVPNLKRIVRSGRPYTIPDVKDEPDWIKFPETEWIRSYAGAPIESKGQIIGILNLCSEIAGFYSQPHADALQSFADQAAVAIENARLFTQATKELEERQRAEQELMRLSEFNSSILEEMADGVTVQDVEGSFTFINPAAAALFGYASAEMIGQEWTKFIPPDQQRLVEQADERRRRGGSDRYEIELQNKAGKRIPILVSGRPRYQNGEFAGTIAVFTDITERKRVEEAERAYLRAKEEFLLSASHSLRTPLHTTLGFLELLASGQVEDDEVRRDFLERALHDAQHVAELIERVVRTARMEAGSVELQIERMSTDELLADTLPSFESLAEEKGIVLEWSMTEGPTPLWADRTLLRQALGNLVENAIRYSENGTTVRVEAGPKAGLVEIRVIDQGPGISRADQAAMLQQLHLRRDDGPQSREAFGLGIYLTRTIVEAHGGSLHLESEPGKGSVFTIVMPGDD